MRRTRAEAAAGRTLCVDLFAPGMTALHRVGLAGLAMTLQALEVDGAASSLRDTGDWQVDERGVTLKWTGDGKGFFDALIAASFRLTDSGLIWLPALGHPLEYPGHAVVLHNAVLGTFLQHTSTRGACKQKRPFSVEVDEHIYTQTFLPLTWYKHQRVNFDPSRPMPVAGWLHPGGTVRHVWASAQTSLSEEPSRALALLYAPVGAVYFQVHRSAVGIRPQCCVVLPAVADLRHYAEVRQCFLRQGVAQLQVSGAAEAAVRVLAELEARNLLRALGARSCSVMAFGTAPWSKQQKTRVQCFTVAAATRHSLRIYRAAAQALGPRLVPSKPDAETGEVRRWWAVPQVPDLVAQNAIEGAPWWKGFADLWDRMRQGAKPDQREWVLQSEKEGLKLMIGNTALLDGPEARLVGACQEAWRRRLGALSERATRQGLNFSDLAKREYERVRISFARCKSAAMLRQTLTDFWSRAGSLPDLQEGWLEILPMLANRWQETRDLALLALASYKGQPGDEDTKAEEEPNE